MLEVKLSVSLEKHFGGRLRVEYTHERKLRLFFSWNPKTSDSDL